MTENFRLLFIKQSKKKHNKKNTSVEIKYKLKMQKKNKLNKTLLKFEKSLKKFIKS